MSVLGARSCQQIVTDIPRDNSACPPTKADGTQRTQGVSAGRVFVAYGAIPGTTSSILSSHSRDSEATWEILYCKPEREVRPLR